MRIRMMTTALCAALALAAPSAALAGNGNGHGKGHGNGKAKAHAQVHVKGIDCPPGLAKKNPPCVPPGLAREVYRAKPEVRVYDRDVVVRHDHDVYDDDLRLGHNGYVYDYRDGRTLGDGYGYRVGRTLDGDYVLIDDPLRYGLDPALTYARSGDMILHVDRDTLEVIAAIGVVDALLN